MSSTLNDNRWVSVSLANGTRDVHIAEAKVSTLGEEWEHSLDAGERDRAARFALKQDRARFIAGRALLRRMLGTFIGIGPGDVRFAVEPRGKPRLVGRNVEFNVSHSADIALVAVATRPLGIDVEVMRPDVEFEAVAESVFSGHEQHALARSGAGERMEAFYRIWTRKEAFIKAVGDGLSFPLAGFDVSAAPNGGLIECRVPPHDATLWTLRSLEIDRGYAAALAVAGQVDRVWRWELAGDAQLSLVRDSESQEALVEI